MDDVETCRVCTGAVLVMAHRGTGLCGQVCAKKEDAEKGQPESEVPRAEPECSTS